MSGANSDGGFKMLICEEDSHDEGPYAHPNRSRQEFVYRVTPWGLAILAVVLLIVDICLGVHYQNLKETFLTFNDIGHISSELIKLQDTYQSAIETMKGYKKQLDSENKRQMQTNWEFEHQTRRSQNYEAELVKMTQDITKLSNYLPMIDGGCRHCPTGWILMNSLCHYFSLSEHDGYITWQKAREFCQLHGGDLPVIDSKDKENSIVTHLMNFKKPNSNDGFWFGLRDSHEEGTWKWLNGTELVEGYWNDGEPNDINNEDCAAVYAKENFFKAWNDVGCDSRMSWICVKAPTSLS